MKRTIFLILFMLPLITFSQTTYPLVKDSAIWREGATPYLAPYERAQFYMQGDTLLDGKSYTKVYQTNYDSAMISNKDYVGAMREDSLQRVYFWRDSAFTGYSHSPSFHPDFTDTAEVLLYDFSLTPGDTFFIPNMRDSIMVLDTIDRTYVSGEYRKTFHFYTVGGPWGDAWIEGLGSTHGLFFPAKFEFECSFNLNCYQDKDIFWTNPDISAGCFEVSVEENEQETSKLHVYPNPVTKYFTVASESVRIESVELYNLSGQVIFSKKANNKQVKLNVAGYQPGFYFIRVRTEKGTATKKIVVSGR